MKSLILRCSWWILLIPCVVMFLKKWSESCSVMSDSFQPHGLYSPWNSPGQNTVVGSLSLLQWIFPTQELNWGSPASQADSLPAELSRGFTLKNDCTSKRNNSKWRNLIYFLGLNYWFLWSLFNYLYVYNLLLSLPKFRAVCVCVCVCVLSCIHLCDPMDCSLSGSSVHGILQGRILEWGAISFSGDHPHPGIEPASPVSPALQADSFTGWATGEALSLRLALFKTRLGSPSKTQPPVRVSLVNKCAASLYTHCLQPHLLI